MLFGALLQKTRQRLDQFRKTAVALGQLLPDVLIVGGFYQVAHFLAQQMEREREAVLHQVRLADAQFSPGATSSGTGVPPLRSLEFVAGRLDVVEEGLALLQ